MTILQVYNLLIGTLVDKAGDPSIEDSDFNNLYYASALSVLKDDFNNLYNRREGGELPYAFEMSDVDTMKWRTLIKAINVTTGANGQVTYATILTSYAGRELFHLSSVIRDGVMCRYCRHNDYARWIANDFIKPTEDLPLWRGFDTYIQAEPQAVKTLNLVAILLPVKAILDRTIPNNSVQPDLTDQALMSIVCRMAAYYGVQIREEQLYQMANQQEAKQ